MEDRNQKLEKLLGDESFIRELDTAQTREQIQEIYRKHGVELSREEVDAFLAVATSDGAELDETALETVAGGAYWTAARVFSAAWNVFTWGAKGAWNLGKKFANWEDGR